MPTIFMPGYFDRISFVSYLKVKICLWSTLRKSLCVTKYLYTLYYWANEKKVVKMTVTVKVTQAICILYETCQLCDVQCQQG